MVDAADGILVVRRVRVLLGGAGLASTDGDGRREPHPSDPNRVGSLPSIHSGVAPLPVPIAIVPAWRGHRRSDSARPWSTWESTRLLPASPGSSCRTACPHHVWAAADANPLDPATTGLYDAAGARACLHSCLSSLFAFIGKEGSMPTTTILVSSVATAAIRGAR
jgi:hypothetical protein